MSWWDAESAVADGLITFGEMTMLAKLLVLERVAERRRSAASHARYLRDRASIAVPKEISELDLLQAVATAVTENDEAVRGYHWYREAVERGEDPETDSFHDDYFGHATCDEIAAALMDVPIEESWKVRYSRRVVAPLGRMLAAGLVCRGERSGAAYGYELTLEGVDMLVDAGAIDALAEVVR